ncbi:unnamed protein product [Orchesella dallaii]|uniref:Uncharacterized protein n=1 Tax=Orchesella dallaii TaxID=48710 RepID=A0ABP1RH95_9HEXA
MLLTAFLIFALLLPLTNGISTGLWAIGKKVLMGILTGGVVAGVDQAVDAGRSRDVVAYQQPGPMPSQNADTAVYVIIVSGTLGGIGAILILILLLYICNISRRPQAGPETMEMRSV